MLDAEQAVEATFHLKHVPQSNEPLNRPGAYERAKASAAEIAKNYVEDHFNDFERERTLEATFEIPAANCVITGAIDLLLHEDPDGAADQMLGENARTGSVHLLKDNKRIEIPITQNAVNAALVNIEWAVQGILASDFPMRPHSGKCAKCDFAMICPRTPQNFAAQIPAPPPLHLPGGLTEMARAFSLYQGQDDAG
jgi:DNA helicase-2/ATP-dependent DNA helicase PcrA